MALGLGLVIIGGCAAASGDDGGKPQPQTKAEQDKQRQDQIDAIKNNPNMPEQQKAMALGALQSNQSNVKK